MIFFLQTKNTISPAAGPLQEQHDIPLAYLTPPPQWVGFDNIMTMTYPTTAESHLQLKLMGGVVKDHPILLVVKVYKFLEINDIELRKAF